MSNVNIAYTVYKYLTISILLMKFFIRNFSLHVYSTNIMCNYTNIATVISSITINKSIPSNDGSALI